MNNLLLTVSTELTSTLIQPLDIRWEPKEDITIYELAKCMPLLLIMNRQPVMPHMINASEIWMRHFKIISHTY